MSVSDMSTQLVNQGHKFAIANLCQNPSQRCVVGHLCPTLLKAGNMWLIAKDPDFSKHPQPHLEERALLPKDFIMLSAVAVIVICFEPCLESFVMTFSLLD